MSAIEKKVIEVLKTETVKRTKLEPLAERHRKLVSKGAVQKSNYSFPLKDTIGRTYSFNTKGK